MISIANFIPCDIADMWAQMISWKQLAFQGGQLERDTQHPHVVQNVSCYECKTPVMLFGLATLSLSSRLTSPPPCSSPLHPSSSGVTVNSLMEDVLGDQLKRPIDRGDKAMCFQLPLPAQGCWGRPAISMFYATLMSTWQFVKSPAVCVTQYVTGYCSLRVASLFMHYIKRHSRFNDGVVKQWL